MQITSTWTVAIMFAALMVVRGLVAVDGASESNPDVITVNGNPAVIFDATSYQRNAEGWTPAMDDLLVAEEAVMAVAALDDRDPFPFGYRQYAGIVEDGERKIVINSMCKRLDGWDEAFLLVLDGGPCFRQATYNVETGELESFTVNGNA